MQTRNGSRGTSAQSAATQGTSKTTAPKDKPAQPDKPSGQEEEIRAKKITSRRPETLDERPEEVPAEVEAPARDTTTVRTTDQVKLSDVHWKELKSLAKTHNLSGGAFKRAKTLISGGCTPQQAVEAIKDHNRRKFEQRERVESRAKMMRGKHRPSVNPKIKNEEAAKKRTERLSYAKALSMKRIAIYAKETPNQTLTSQQLGQISNVIVDAIADEETIVVKFSGILFQPGTMIIDCQDQESADWLQRTVPSLKNWTGPELEAGPESDAPGNKIVMIYFPREAETENERILKIFSHQNEDINVKVWKVLKSSAISGGKKMVLAIDEASYDHFQAEGMNANYRYGIIEVREIQAKNNRAEKKSEEETKGDTPGPSQDLAVAGPSRTRQPAENADEAMEVNYSDSEYEETADADDFEEEIAQLEAQVKGTPTEQ